MANLVEFKTKVKTDFRGNDYIDVIKKPTKAHFIGRSVWDNSNMLTLMLVDEMKKALNGNMRVYINELPDCVSIKGKFMKTVTIALSEDMK